MFLATAGMACSAAHSALWTTDPITATPVSWHNEQGDLNWDGCTHPFSGWFHGVGDLAGGAFSSDALSVSADGAVVVGVSEAVLVQGGDPAPLAFTWTACQGIAALATPGQAGFSSEALGASANGSVVVGIGQGADGASIAATWAATGAVDIVSSQSGSLQTIATGITGDGLSIVGATVNGDSSEAFVYQVGASDATHLGALPGGSGWSRANAVSALGNLVVGESSSAGGVQAFIWTPQSGMLGLGGLPGAPLASNATAVSADGATVVGQAASTNGQAAFAWTAATGMVALGEIANGTHVSAALGVSADGRVIVGYNTTTSGRRAVMYDAVNGVRRVRDVLNAQGITGLNGWILTSANGVSADGLTIVGSGIDPSGHTEGWVAHLIPPCGPAQSQAFFDFVEAFFAGNADFNNDGVTNSDDFFAFMTSYFAGC
jgi:probable HAF family extracellular repeat protein